MTASAPMLDRLADVLVNYSASVKKGDLVAIAGDPVAMPAIRAVYRRVLEAGGHPFWRPRSEELIDDLLECASLDQIRYVPPVETHIAETVDVSIDFWADRNTRATTRVDPARIAAKQQARRPIMLSLMKRLAEGSMRWCGTQFPTEASAQDAR